MVEIPKIATRIVAEEALRKNLQNLEETIGKLVNLAKSLPEVLANTQKRPRPNV